MREVFLSSPEILSFLRGLSCGRRRNRDCVDLIFARQRKCREVRQIMKVCSNIPTILHYKFNFFSQIAFINYAVVDYIQSSHYFSADPSIYSESLAEHLHLNEPWKRNFPSSKFNQVECGSQIRYHSIFSQACSNCTGQVFHTCHVSHESFH